MQIQFTKKTTTCAALAVALAAAVLLLTVAPSASASSDIVLLEELTNQYLTGTYAVPTTPQITQYAIDKSTRTPYALVDWKGTPPMAPSGGEFVATKNKSGQWTKLFGGGGEFTVQEMVNLGVPSTVATNLKANLQPLP